jgi:glucose/arabinose dehydrogenase
MCTLLRFAGAALLVLAFAYQPALAEIAGLHRVATGLTAPMFVTHAPNDPNRLFIAERGSPFPSANASASIRILDLTTGVLNPTPFLTMTGINNNGEGGFLGLAFHPNYSTEGMPGFGKFYVSVTTSGSPLTSRIREFEVSAANPNLANSASMREILSFAQPQDNHNGGWIGFSPVDHFLYMSSGDGGGGDDNDAGHTPGTGNAQDTTNNLLGKMLRVDVNGDDFPADAARNYAIPPTNPFKAGVGDPGDDVGDDEIWAYGLRNPFRASFDRMTGDLWIGDVGQSAREEIDFQPASSDGGENYGWRLREGLIATPSGGVGGAKPPDNVDPVYDFDRDADQFGGTVVTGGYVYRGPDPSLQGKYFFMDSRNSGSTADDNYWMFDPADPFATVMNIDSLLPFNTGTPSFPVSFGEDAVGNLYVAYLLSGDVYRINTRVPGDYNNDGDVNEADYSVWRATFGHTPRGGPLPADGNGNSVVDAADYVLWRKNLGAAPSTAAAVPEPATLIFAAVTLLCIALNRR